jgi:hypothetical protein
MTDHLRTGTHDLDNLGHADAENTNSWCTRKGGLQRAFPQDVLMATSPKLSFIANCSNPIGIGLTPGETIHFGSLDFTANCLGRLSLSPKERDSDTIFIGMVHSGSPSLLTTLEDSYNEDGATSSTGGDLDPLDPEGAMW